jgi:hypothetical protein
MFEKFKNKDKKRLPFWEIIGLLDWRFEGDDEKVISPVVEYLSRQSDEYIFTSKWRNIFMKSMAGNGLNSTK